MAITTTVVKSPLPLAVNVKDFGASGNGSFNDTVSIQTAINSISSGTVVFPAGTYLTGTLTLRPGVDLVGLGGNGVKLRPNANNITVLNYLATGSLKSEFLIAGITFQSVARTGCTAIKIDGNASNIRCSNIRIRDVSIQGFSTGIKLRYCANTFLNDIFIAGAANGISIDNCADTDIISVKVQSGSGVGFDIFGGGGAFDEGCRLIGCSTNGQNIGLKIIGQDWGTATGCSFTTAPGGGLIAQQATNWKFVSTEFAVAGSNPAGNTAAIVDSTCSGFSFGQCMFSNSNFGLLLSGSKHSVVGNFAIANYNVDIYLSGATKCAIANNVCESLGSPFSLVEYNGNYNVFTGNIINGLVSIPGANSVAANNIQY